MKRLLFCEVGTLLSARGFEVIDWGINVLAENFVKQVEAHQPDILGLSALLTTTMPQMREIVQSLDKAGLRDDIKVMVGGAPVNQNFVDKIGADGYGHDAAGAVDLTKELLSLKNQKWR